MVNLYFVYKLRQRCLEIHNFKFILSKPVSQWLLGCIVFIDYKLTLFYFFFFNFQAAHAIQLPAAIAFLPTLLNYLFTLLVITTNEEVGLNVIRVLIHIVHMIHEANRKDILQSYVKVGLFPLSGKTHFCLCYLALIWQSWNYEIYEIIEAQIDLQQYFLWKSSIKLTDVK